MAVNIVINYEEGAERSPVDGDVAPETLVDAQYDVPPGERELFSESTYEYGSRVGIWRTLDVLTDYAITPTIFACAAAFERNPRVAAALAERGCDFVGHGYRWLSHVGMDSETERSHIQQCIQSLQQTVGATVRGWFTRPPQTVRTRQLLAEEGLLYDSGAVNDDLPYFDIVHRRPFLVVPYTLDVNDIKFYKNQFFTSQDFCDYVLDTFDVLYRESATSPKMMSIGLHARVIGRPGRTNGLRRALEQMSSSSGVWFAGRDAIANFWASQFAPPETWNWPARARSVTNEPD